MKSTRKRFGQKTLSVLLTVLMVVSMIPAITFTFLKDHIAEAANPTVHFYVPEAVYLKQGSYGTQWYLNSYRSSSTQSWASAKETTGKLYFYCPGATSVKITTSGGTVSNLTTTGTDTINDTDFQITGTGGNVVTFTATYVVGGVTKTASSYTYLYTPNRVPTGVATEAESEKYSWSSYTYYGFISVLWGAQSYDTKANNGGTDGACYAENGNIYLGNKGLNAGSGNQRPHNTNMLEYGTGTFGYHNNDNKTTSMTSPTCYFYVDGSRYTNMSQIPNMYYGLTLTDDENTYSGSDAHCLLYSFLADGHTSGASEPSALTGRIVDWEGDGERVLAQEGDKTIGYGLNIGAGSSHNYTLYTYGRGWGKKDTWSHHHIHFQLINNYKGDLRNLYLSELRNSYNRQSSYYTSGWDAYVSAMKNAATVLGNPYVAYSTVTGAISTLNSAISGLVAKAPKVVRGTYVKNGVDGYWAYAYVETNGGADINRVQFPSWTDKVVNGNSQDDIQSNWGTNSAASGTAGSWTVGGQTYNYRYYVKVSDHNTEYENYNTHIYAYNNVGAQHSGSIGAKVTFNYAVKYTGNGNTAGSTTNQTVVYGTPTTISSNGYTRTYAITYNKNGGDSASKSSETETWTFNGWEGSTSTQGYLINDATERSGTGGASGYTDFAQWTIAQPFATGEEYTLEFDAYGSGTLINYFYGESGYLTCAKAVSSNGRTSTGGDGNITATMTGSWVHYKIVWTLGSSGNAAVNKRVLFRAQQGTGNVIHIANVKFYQTKFVNGSKMLNLSTGGDYNMKALWTAGSVKMPSAARAGWTLVGWNTSATATTSLYNYDATGNTSYTIGANKTLYAIWSRDITNTYHWRSADDSQDVTDTASGTAYNAETTLTLTSPAKANVAETVSANGKTWTLKGWNEQNSVTWGGANATAAVGFGAGHSVATTASAHTFMPVYALTATKFYANFNYLTDGGVEAVQKNDVTVNGDAATGDMPVPPVTRDGAENGAIKYIYSEDGVIYRLTGWTGVMYDGTPVSITAGNPDGGTAAEIAGDVTKTMQVPGATDADKHNTANTTPIELTPQYEVVGTTINAKFKYYDANGNAQYFDFASMAKGAAATGDVFMPSANQVTNAYTKNGVTYTLKGWNRDASDENEIPFGGSEALAVLADPATDYYTYYPVYECTTTARYHTYTAAGAVTSSTEASSEKKTDASTPGATDVAIPAAGFNKTITLDGRTFTFCGWRTDTTANADATVATTVTAQSHAIRDAEYVYYAVYKNDALTLSYDAAHDGVTAAPVPASQTGVQYISTATGNADINNVAELNFAINPDNTIPVKKGYTFIGWGNVDSEEETFDYAPTGATLQTRIDKSLFARFRVNDMNVTFVYYDGADLEGDYRHEVKTVSYDDLKRDDTATNDRYVVTAPTVKLVGADNVINMTNIVHANNKYHYVFQKWERSDGKGIHTASVNGIDYTVTYKNVEEDITVQGIYDAFPHHYETLTSAQVQALPSKFNPDGDTTAAKDATCTKDGYQYLKCTDCGHVYKQIIPKIDHKNENGVPVVTYSGYKAPTCTATGKYATAVCALCGDLVKTEDGARARYYGIEGNAYVEADSADGVIPATGHNYAFTETVAPTCTEKGYDLYVCANNATHTEKRNEVPEKSHTEATTPGTPATCTEPGSSDGVVCSVCNRVIAASYTIPATGHNMVKTAAKAATCTEDGNVEYYTCTNCGKLFADKNGAAELTAEAAVIAALGHDYEETPAEEATCTKAGHTAGKVCSRCGEIAPGSTASETQPALGHDLDEGTHTDSDKPCQTPGYTTYACQREGCDYTEVVNDELAPHTEKTLPDQPATCTAMGKSSYKICEVCGKTLTNYKWLPMKAHTYTVVQTAETPATCETAGTSAVMKCANCDAVVGGDAIAALGHNYSAWIVTEATCETDGARTKYCKRCGATVTEPIPASGHTPKDVAEVPATCSAEGVSAGKICEICGDVLEGCEAIPMLPHAMGEPAIVREPTCAQEGLEITTCANCDYQVVEMIEKLPHTELTVEEAVAPTCNTAGTKAKIVCDVCGELIQAPAVVAKLDHVWQTIPAVAPTCAAKGTTAYEKCVNCGVNLTEPRDVPAKGHVWGEWQLVKAATCLEDGSRVRYCTVEGCEAGSAVVDADQTKTLDKLGHNMKLVPEKAASCGVEGYISYYSCTRCAGRYFKNELGTEEYASYDEIRREALDHNWLQTETAEPTCTTKGCTLQTCSNCGDTRIVDETDALGHSGGTATCTERAKCEVCGEYYGSLEPHNYVTKSTAGSCIEKKVITKYCIVCGEVVSTTEGDYGPHQYDEDTEIAVQEQTCTQDGIYRCTCTLCGEENEIVIPAMGHVDEDNDGKCDRCSESLAPTPADDSGNGTTTGTCEKCGRNHVGKTGGFFGYDGFVCKLISFFRMIKNLFSK